MKAMCQIFPLNGCRAHFQAAPLKQSVTVLSENLASFTISACFGFVSDVYVNRRSALICGYLLGIILSLATGSFPYPAPLLESVEVNLQDLSFK